MNTVIYPLMEPNCTEPSFVLKEFPGILVSKSTGGNDVSDKASLHYSNYHSKLVRFKEQKKYFFTF